MAVDGTEGRLSANVSISGVGGFDRAAASGGCSAAGAAAPNDGGARPVTLSQHHRCDSAPGAASRDPGAAGHGARRPSRECHRRGAQQLTAWHPANDRTPATSDSFPQFTPPLLIAPGELAAGIYDLSVQVPFQVRRPPTACRLPLRLTSMRGRREHWRPATRTSPCPARRSCGRASRSGSSSATSRAVDAFTAPTKSPSFTYPNLQATNGAVRRGFVWTGSRAASSTGQCRRRSSPARRYR